MPDHDGRGGEGCASGSRSSNSRQVVRRLVAALVTCAGGFLLAVLVGDAVASAAVTVTCTDNGTITVSLAGTSVDDTLVVTSGSGVYGVSLDGSAQCTGQTLSDTESLQVSETASPLVPTVFVLGSDANVHVSGASGASNVLNLSGLGGGEQVTIGGAADSASQTSFSVPGGSSTAAHISTVIGGSVGGTTFTASTGGGWTFTGQGGGNTLSLADVGTGATANLATGAAQVGPSATDTFSNISAAVASAAGATTFVAGSGSETFVGPAGAAPGCTIDFSDVDTTSSPLDVNLTGSPVGGTPSNEATVGTATYTFSQGASGFTNFVGPSGGNSVFFPSATRAVGMTAAGVGNSLNFEADTQALAVNNATGQATWTTLTDSFSGFQTLVGAGSGNTHFVTGADPGFDFQGLGNGNVLDLGPDPTGPTIDLVTDTVDLGQSAVDSFSGITSVAGSTSGGTTFVAGNGNETFADQGSGTAGDTVDFSNVATSGATPMTVNVAGTTVGVVANHTAVGSGWTYTFTSGASHFTTFVGPTDGNTTFAAGSTGGYTFGGQGPGNTLDLSSAPQSPTVDFASGVATVGASASDTFSGIAAAVGSGAGGTTYVAGSSSETFADPSSVGPHATLDFSAQTATGAAPLVVNLTGSIQSGVGAHTASLDGNTYNFTAGASRFTTVNGADGGNTVAFADPTTSDSLTASGSNNTLSFAALTPPLTVDVSSDPGSASTSSLSDSLSGFQTIVGATTGNTTFSVGAAGGFDLEGESGGNVLDLTNAPAGATVDSGNGVARIDASTSDQFTNVTNFIGSSAGSTTFDLPVGTVTVLGQGAGNAANFSAAAHAVAASMGPSSTTVTSPDVKATLTGVSSYVGTQFDDTFTQTAPGSYDLSGGGGVDSLDLTALSSTDVSEALPSAGCGDTTHDGSATTTGVDDAFHCFAHVSFNGPPANPIATGVTLGKGGAVTVGWVDPTDDGGSPITGYDVYCSTGAPSSSGTPAATTSDATATSLRISGLTSGVHYSCALTAVSSLGQSPLSPLVHVTPDATGPVVSVTSPRAPFQLAGRVTTAYAATDVNGVASYDVRYRLARWNGSFGSWTAPSGWQSTTKKSQTLAVATGTQACFEVRARDGLGNLSGWSSQRCASRPLDDRALTAATKGWTRGVDTAAYLGTVTRTTTKGAKLTLKGVHFDRLALVVTKCSRCGHVAIYIGGTLWKTVNTYAASTRHHVLIVEPRGPERKTTVTVKAVNTNKRVVIDGLGASRG